MLPCPCPQLWGLLHVQGSGRLGCSVRLREHRSGFWHRSTPQMVPAAPALLTCAWQFLFPGSAGRAALHPQQHKWGWLKEWKMLVINRQPGSTGSVSLIPASPMLNPTGGGMAGLLCFLGLIVNIQPLTSQLESHLVISINV